MKIAVIIVLYNSLPKNYHDIISLDYIIFVDNTPNRDLRLCGTNVAYLPLFENKGIATAQNIGIKKAIELECTHIVFFDQDSNFSKEYVNNILTEYLKIDNQNSNLFLLGPIVYNEKCNTEYKSIIHKYNTDDMGFQHRREIISSGSCVSIEKLSQIGFLDESLFIDDVDYEWCWRANSLGYKSGITTKVILKHNVGQIEIKICGYSIIVSSPFRYFYQYRNYIWLCKRKYVPFAWKRNTGIKYFCRLIYFPFLIKDGMKILKYMWKGIIAGLKNN